MGASLECVFRDTDEDFIEPTSKTISFREDGKTDKGSPKARDRALTLPLLLGTQSSPKLYYIADLCDSYQQSPACNFYNTSWGAPNSGQICMSSPRLSPRRGVDALAKLREGNRLFLAAKLPQHNEAEVTVTPIVSFLCCTPPPLPLDVLFGLDRREIACVASASLDACSADDCGSAAVELSMVQQEDLPLVVIIETIGKNETEIDARRRMWAGVERLLSNSNSLRVSIQNGVLLNAALLEAKTGEVRFLGEHANQHKLFVRTPRFGYQENPSFCMEEEFMAKDTQPIVPAEEALALLQCGNLRASRGPCKPNAGCSPRLGNEDDQDLNHNPFVVILTSFDKCKGEGPPLEVLFDLHPSEVCAISTIPMPTDGSEETYADCTPDEQWRSHIHLIEQVLATKAPRLLLVLARAAVDAPSDEVQGVKESVLNDMWKLLTLSTTIKAGVADGQLQVLGSVYHGDGNVEMPPGEIEWLGGHPLQERIISRMASLYPPSGVLSVQDLFDQLPPTPRGRVNQVLEDCLAGNERFLLRNAQSIRSDWKSMKLSGDNICPKALILAGADGNVRAPERLLDASPGQFLVHRTCGAIGGRSHGCAIRFLEDLLEKNPTIPLLLVLGDVCDPVLSFATTRLQQRAKIFKYPNAQMALEQMAPAVVQALAATDCDGAHRNAQQQLETMEFTTELHIRYVLERLLSDSDLVIDRVAMGQLEVQGAIVQADGRLRMLGGPDVHRLIGQKARVERHRRKGVGLGRARTKGRQFIYTPRS